MLEGISVSLIRYVGRQTLSDTLMPSEGCNKVQPANRGGLLPARVRVVGVETAHRVRCGVALKLNADDVRGRGHFLGGDCANRAPADACRLRLCRSLLRFCVFSKAAQRERCARTQASPPEVSTFCASVHVGDEPTDSPSLQGASGSPLPTRREYKLTMHVCRSSMRSMSPGW